MASRPISGGGHAKPLAFTGFIAGFTTSSLRLQPSRRNDKGSRFT